MQGDLFATTPLGGGGPDPNLPLQQDQLLRWQQLLHDHQAPLFRGEPAAAGQASLFPDDLTDTAAALDPLSLTPLPLSF